MHNYALLLNIDGPRLAITGQVEKNASLGVLIPTCGSGVEPPWCARVIIPKSIHLSHLGESMAKRKSSTRRVPKVQPAITDLYFTADTAGQGDSRSYVDTARALSRANRRLYSQGKMYAYQGLTFIWRSAAAAGAQQLTSVEVSIRTAGNTWIVHNAYVKGKALWNQMNDLVLEDNPSIKGKWADFKLDLASSQNSTRTLNVLDGSGTPILAGEWTKSKYVMPQHQVSDGTQIDPVTGLPIPMGEPLPAEDFTALLIGGETASKRSLVKAYQESRATVQPFDPNVPAAMSTSFFNLLTDSGSQEPELADIIENENDQPPYEPDEYPGGANNADVPMTVAYAAVSSAEVDGRIGGFVAPCGLLEIDIKGYDQDGVDFPLANMPAIDILLHVAPGMYKGVAAIEMGQ